MNANQTYQCPPMPVDPNRTNPIWMDLYDYIQSCDRDDYGMNYPFGREGATPWGFQVYMGKNQVNVCLKDVHGIYSSVMNFVFEDHDETGKPTKVWIVPVNKKGVADYDSNYRLDVTEYISGPDATDWHTISSYKGSTVKEVFRDLLIPMMPGNNKKGE